MRPSGFWLHAVRKALKKWRTWLEATAICSSQTPQPRNISRNVSSGANISPLGHRKVVGDEQAVFFCFFFRFLFSFKGGDASGGCVNADVEV